MPITFVPLPGKVVQRKTNGTFDSFHQSDVSNCMREGSFQDQIKNNTFQNSTSSCHHSSSSFDEIESKSRSLIRKKMQMRGGIVSCVHLKVASEKLVDRFSDNTKDLRPMSEMIPKRAISADTLCGRSASRAMSSINAETEAPRSTPSPNNIRPVAPWLDAPPSEPIHRRNMNSRGAGHVRSMLPSNQLKPGRGVPLNEFSFDWTATASSMETNGTVMDPKHYKPDRSLEELGKKNKILTTQLPLAMTERSNAVTTELIHAHNRSGVPLTATNTYTPRVIVPGIKTLNPFGAPPKATQKGYLSQPPTSTRPRPSTTYHGSTNGSRNRTANGSQRHQKMTEAGSSPTTQQSSVSSSPFSSARPRTTPSPKPGTFRLTEKLHPRNTKERIFDPKEPTAAEVQLAKTLNNVTPDGSIAPLDEGELAASQWGELTSVVDMYMHPSNNVNRKYPTPDWVPEKMKSRNAFKLRV